MMRVPTANARRGRSEPDKETGFDQVVNVRMSAAEKEALRQIAFLAGVSVSALVRRRCWGRRVETSPLLGIMEYLRRASENVHAAQRHGGDPEMHAHAEAALGWLHEAMSVLRLNVNGAGKSERP